MYAALFEMTSWMGPEQYIVKGETPADLLAEFEEYQSLTCLVRMGRRNEKASVQPELDKLEEILHKRDFGILTVADLLTLDIKTSLGTIRCATVVDGEEAIQQLRADYPKAR